MINDAVVNQKGECQKCFFLKFRKSSKDQLYENYLNKYPRGINDKKSHGQIFKSF